MGRVGVLRQAATPTEISLFSAAIIEYSVCRQREDFVILTL